MCDFYLITYQNFDCWKCFVAVSESPCPGIPGVPSLTPGSQVWVPLANNTAVYVACFQILLKVVLIQRLLFVCGSCSLQLAALLFNLSLLCYFHQPKAKHYTITHKAICRDNHYYMIYTIQHLQRKICWQTSHSLLFTGKMNLPIYSVLCSAVHYRY